MGEWPTPTIVDKEQLDVLKTLERLGFADLDVTQVNEPVADELYVVQVWSPGALRGMHYFYSPADGEYSISWSADAEI